MASAKSATFSISETHTNKHKRTHRQQDLGKPRYKKKRKSSDNVTRGGPPPLAPASDSLGVRSGPPPSSDTLGVRS